MGDCSGGEHLNGWIAIGEEWLNGGQCFMGLWSNGFQGVQYSCHSRAWYSKTLGQFGHGSRGYGTKPRINPHIATARPRLIPIYHVWYGWLRRFAQKLKSLQNFQRAGIHARFL